MHSRVWASIGVVVGVLGLGTLGAEWGCSNILGLDAKTLGDLDSGVVVGDSAAAETAAEASAQDAGPGNGACPEDGGIAPGYHDVTSPTCWTTFDLMIVDPNAQGYSGATFDGRYVYLAPAATGSVARLDTTADFTTGIAWSTYDPTGATQGTFMGAVFDGRYVYFVPASTGSLATRYDTKAPFSAATSWTTFDTSKLNADATDFSGGTFDGRYVYMAPSAAGNAPALLVRYDTTMGFGSAASWSTFDATGLDPTISGFGGAVFDGRYVYFAPNGIADLGVSARFDTRAGSFTALSSWTKFSFISVDKNAYGFQGAAFDGSFIYFAPAYNGNGSPGGTALRYGTGGSFTSPSSWAPFPPAELVPSATSYAGATFDGRYVYFAPTGGGGEDNGFLLQYDTTAAAFTSKSSWRSFATPSINSNALDFEGAVFDGRYVYLVPLGSVVARFDARAPGPLPTLGDSGVPFHGSFF